MLMQTAREQIVDYGKRLIRERLTAGTAGNLSMFDPDTGWMAISPSGVPYEATTAEDVVIMDLEGHVIEGARKPSSEHELHSIFYRKRSDARAVVHAHSMFCTALACLHQPLISVHYALAEAQAPRLPLVPYHTYGTSELAQAVGRALEEPGNGMLLANHGMAAYGDSMSRAFGLALTMEWCAELQWRTMCAGEPKVLTDEQMAEVMEHYKTYGQPRADGTTAHGYNG